MELQKAKELAEAYLSNTFKIQEGSLLVEEFEEDTEKGWYYLTVSYIDLTSNTFNIQNIIQMRTIKYLKIDIAEEKVIAMKSRPLK